MCIRDRSKIDMPSVQNGLDGVKKEISTRYDFKGSMCEVEQQEEDGILVEEGNRGKIVSYGADCCFVKDIAEGIMTALHENGEMWKSPPEEVFMEILAGPYGPLMRTLSRIVNLSSRAVTSKKRETRKRAEDELLERMTIEVMGNLGLLPFYKDIRRIMLKDRFAKNPNILTEAQKKLLRERLLKILSNISRPPLKIIMSLTLCAICVL